jgi:hypothetical protein
MKLNFGVIDVPYTEENSETTGEVAQKLEDVYGIMETFSRIHEDFITISLEVDIIKSLENTMKGINSNVGFNESCSRIEKMFRTALDQKEFNYTHRGIPTQAAKDGVSHRFKYKNRKRASKQRVRDKPDRPSFIDTGLYQISFKAWVD